MHVPVVSIIMITYNRSKYIAEAIQSVLAQSFGDWELLILDDASTDTTQEVVKQFTYDGRIRYIKNDNNLGIAKNRNKALCLARGKYVAVLDSDDIWCESNKLAEQVFFLNTHTEHALIGGGMIIVDQQRRELGRYNPKSEDWAIRKRILIKNCFVHSSVMFRKTVVEKVGGYNERLEIGEDYELWLRMGRVAKIANSGSYYVQYRRHGENISLKTLRALENNINIIRAFRSDYPFYLTAWIRRMVRWLVYKCLFA